MDNQLTAYSTKILLNAEHNISTINLMGMIRNTGEVIMSFLGKCSQEVADYVMTIDDPSTQRKLLILHVVPNMQVSV